MFETTLYEKKILGLNSISLEEFKNQIDSIGFTCNSCGYCCTKKSNSYIFLLDLDTEYFKSKNINCLEIPDELDYCDQYGNFYVAGYSMKTKNDLEGSCFFLNSNRCKIYKNRPLICKIYPYMIFQDKKKHKESWMFFGGINKHGTYNRNILQNSINIEHIFNLTKIYEKKALQQEINFRKYLSYHFQNNSLYHTSQNYDRFIRLIKNKKVKKYIVYVFYQNSFDKIEVSI